MAGSPTSTSPHHAPVVPPAVRDGAVALPHVPHVVTLGGARVVLWDTSKRRAGKLASDPAQALVALLVHGADRQREDVAAILANAACDKHNRRELALAGAIPLLVRAITYAANDRIQYKTFIGKLSRALANLAWRNTDNQLQIEASGGVDALVDILATGTSNDELEIQDEAATALSHLLDHREIARRVLDSRNKTVLEELARVGGSPQQRAQAAWMLSKLSRHTVTVSATPDVTVDIPALVQLLSTSSDHGVRAASVLRRLSRDVAHKSQIVVAGGLTPLIWLLQHGQKESQRVNAAWTLGHLAWNAFSEAQIAKAGAIPPLVELLQTSNVREREGAVWALRHLSCTSDNRHRLGSLPQAIPSLVNSVRAAGSSCEREHALATLKNLACSSDNQTAIGSAGAIPLLVAVLTQGTSSEIVEAAATLRNLVRDHLQNQSFVVRARGLRPLIELLSSGDDMQQIHAAATLANLASDLDLQNEIVAEGALPIALMLTETSDAALREYVAQFVRNLIWRNDAIQTRIGASGVIPRVVAMLSHSDGLKKQAAAILRNLAWQHATNQAHILATDAVAALLEILAVGTAGQREEAAGAIANLTWNNPTAQEQVASDNGLGPLAELTASRNGSNDKLQKQATLAIRHCVFNGHKKVQVAAPSVIPSFVSLLSSGSTQQEQQATWAIANLACNPENKAEIVSSGAIPPLVVVLSSGSTSQRQYAASALANLACNHEHKMEILDANGAAPLIDLVARGSEGQKKQAAWALRNLAWNCTEGQAAIAAANGIPVLVELVETGTDLQIEHAAAALANLACLDENQPHISLAGGIHALVQLVNRGSDGQKLQAAWALANLSMSPSNRAGIVDAGGVAALQRIASSGTPDQQRGASAALARINDPTSPNSPTAPESHAVFRSPSDGSDENDRSPLRDLLRVGSARTNVSPQPTHEIKIGRALYRSISSVPEIITLNPSAMVENSSTRSPSAQLNHTPSFSLRRAPDRRPQLQHLPSVQEIDSSASSRVIESSGWSAFDEHDAMNPPDSRMLQRARSANPPARVAVRMPSSPVDPMRSNQNRPKLPRPSTLGDLLDPHGGYSPPKDAVLRRNIARVQSDMDMILAKAQSQQRLSPVWDRENVPSNLPAMHRSPSNGVEYRTGRLAQRIEESSSSSNHERRGSRGEIVEAGEQTLGGMLQRRRSSHPAVAPLVDQQKHRNSAGSSSDRRFFGSMPLAAEQSQSGNEEVFEFDENSDDIAFQTSAAHATPEMESKYPIISL